MGFSLSILLDYMCYNDDIYEEIKYPLLGAPMEMGREREWETCAAHSAPVSFSVLAGGCRRAASFPYFGDTSIHSSNLKVRSQSESEGLNKMRLKPVQFNSLQTRIHKETIKENVHPTPNVFFKSTEQKRTTLTVPDEGSDYQSHSSSSSDFGADDGDIFCAGPLEIPDEVKTAKSVKFADDCGKQLYTIRVATEPSDCPPKLSPSVLRRYRGDSFDEEKSEPAPLWNLLFKQPAADYVRFREKLENIKISLENVILDNEGYKVIGTVKVGNIAFEKNVFVRYTINGWISYMDKVAQYQPSTSKLYDSFKFEINLPTLTEKVYRLEFCICFKANGVEYWDSNDGANYVLQCDQNLNGGSNQRRTSLFGSSKYLDRDDAYKLDYNDWSKFASWKALSTDGPYW